MTTGKVKFFNTQKGYGFVIEDQTEKEFFVHVTNVKGTIAKDNFVTFDIEESKRGLIAVNVKEI
jgi:CspA family cold shock protein